MSREPAITVSQLNRRAKSLLEAGIAKLWVEGEISNMARPASGHIYFSLKDEKAQVRAAWFRQRQRGPAISFKDGDKVLVVCLFRGRQMVHKDVGEEVVMGVVKALDDIAKVETPIRMEGRRMVLMLTKK